MFYKTDYKSSRCLQVSVNTFGSLSFIIRKIIPSVHLIYALKPTLIIIHVMHFFYHAHNLLFNGYNSCNQGLSRKNSNILRQNFNLPIHWHCKNLKNQGLHVCVVHKPECDYAPILVHELTLGKRRCMV